MEACCVIVENRYFKPISAMCLRRIQFVFVVKEGTITSPITTGINLFLLGDQTWVDSSLSPTCESTQDTLKAVKSHRDQLLPTTLCHYIPRRIHRSIRLWQHENVSLSLSPQDSSLDSRGLAKSSCNNLMSLPGENFEFNDVLALGNKIKRISCSSAMCFSINN